MTLGSNSGIGRGMEEVGKELVTWISRPGLSRKVVVPDFVGESASSCFLLAVRAAVRIQFVQSTVDPSATDGLVCRQAPHAGSRVRRDGTILLTVIHPVARQETRTRQ